MSLPSYTPPGPVANKRWRAGRRVMFRVLKDRNLSWVSEAPAPGANLEKALDKVAAKQ